MTHFRMNVSSFGHQHEPLELGNIQPTSSWNEQVVNPDSVAPQQQDITILDKGDRDAKDIGMHSSEFHTDVPRDRWHHLPLFKIKKKASVFDSIACSIQQRGRFDSLINFKSWFDDVDVDVELTLSWR